MTQQQLPNLPETPPYVPGPYYLRGGYIVADLPGEILDVAIVCNLAALGGNRWDATADLLTAAPELLEALLALLEHSARVNTAFYGRGTSKAMRAAMDGQKELLDRARAAIVKARPATTQAELIFNS